MLPWAVPYVLEKYFNMQGVELDAIKHLPIRFLFSR